MVASSTRGSRDLPEPLTPLTYLTPFAPSRRDALVWGFERMRGHGFDVVALDVGPLLGVSFPDPADGGASAEGWPVIPVADEQALRHQLASRADGFVVDFVVGAGDITLREEPLFRALGEIGSRVVVVNGGAVPVGVSGSGGVARIRHLASRAVSPYSWRNLAAKRRIARTRAAGLGYAPPFRVFSHGPAVGALPINSFDFDRFLDIETAGSMPEQDGTVLFLDEGLTADHPDWAYVGVEPLESGPYFASLRRLFDAVESSTGLRVRIAGHPKVDPAVALAAYGGREVITGRTLELTARAHGVIATATTALSFAALLGRPVLIVTTSGMERNGYVVRARDTAAALGVVALDIDAPAALDSGLDPARWPCDGLAAYREAYVTDTRAPRENTWEIVARELEQVLREEASGRHETEKQ